MSEVTPSPSWVHGTVTGYSSYGCRCDPCRVAKSTAAKAYRERNADKIRAAKAAYYQANRAACDAKNQAWIEANRERDRQVRAARKAADPDHAAKRSAYGRRWYVENRDHVLAYSETYGRANPEVRRAASRKWREKNPERAAEMCRDWASRNKRAVADTSAKRRARKRANDCRTVTKRDWTRLCARYGDRCAYCASVKSLTQDHIIPIVRGGRHAIGNLLPACRSCNSRKRHRLLIESVRGGSSHRLRSKEGRRMAKLTANVLVRHPDTGMVECLLEGSELPDWAADQVGDHVLEGKSDKDAVENDGRKSDDAPPPIAGAGSSKAKWADYASAHGVEVGDDMSRDDIVDACRAKGVRVE